MPDDPLAAVLHEHGLLRNETVQVTGRDSSFAAWAVVLAAGTVTVAFSHWDDNRIVTGIALCVLFPLIAAAIYRGVALYHGDVERIATYLIWLERKYQVLSTNPGALEDEAKNFWRDRKFKGEPGEKALAALTARLGWELWLRRGDRDRPHILSQWADVTQWRTQHQKGLMREYARTRAFRNAVLLIWGSGLLGLAYLLLEWDDLWCPLALLLIYVPALAGLSLLSAIEICDRLRWKTGNFPPGD